MKEMMQFTGSNNKRDPNSSIRLTMPSYVSKLYIILSLSLHSNCHVGIIIPILLKRKQTLREIV